MLLTFREISLSSWPYSCQEPLTISLSQLHRGRRSNPGICSHPRTLLRTDHRQILSGLSCAFFHISLLLPDPLNNSLWRLKRWFPNHVRIYFFIKEMVCPTLDLSIDIVFGLLRLAKQGWREFQLSGLSARPQADNTFAVARFPSSLTQMHINYSRYSDNKPSALHHQQGICKFTIQTGFPQKKPCLCYEFSKSWY